MKRQMLIALVALFIRVQLGLAQNLHEVSLPDTPAGRQLGKLLAAVESDNPVANVEELFSASFLERARRQDDLDLFRQMKVMHGGFTVHLIEQSSKYALAVIAKSKKRDNTWRRFDLRTEETAPFKVVAFGIDMSSPPDVVRKSMQRMTEAEIVEYASSELQKMEEADTFSGAILIIKDGRPLLKQAYGLASKRFNIPNTVDTRFNIGSINKIFTQIAIAQLLEKGQIQLNEKISAYLPEFPQEKAVKITVRHLLTMSSGLSHYWTDEYWCRWAQIRTVGDLMEIIENQPLDFEPGTGRQYSNSGYVVLGAIIESITGENYYDYVRKNIYEPADMQDTDSYELDQIVPNLAIGYTGNRSDTPYKGSKYQNNLFIHGVKGSPAGGGYSTLDDLQRFVEALKKNTFTRSKYTAMVLNDFHESDERPSGLGIAGGAPVGINAIVEADFDLGYTVIVLSNYDPPTAEEFGLRIMKMLRNQS